MEEGRIAVVDYGMGNLRSVWQALVRVAGAREVVVTADPSVVARAGRVVFPGQGAMPDCMRELDARGLRPAVLDAARTKPFLGICIGLQMLFEHSEEGDVPGLGVFPGRVRRFPAERMAAPGGIRLKVPHMGWNEVAQTRPHALWKGIGDGARFYFVHSYYVDPEDPACAAGVTCHGVPFTSAVARDNIFAMQYHPEKSAQAGLALLSNFVEWTP
ncbi:MAG: imidazole glycerol phosphate synthase subunit HisH [Candidatus Accumulibacter sp.]|jgi:glutamine amidotransferase|nr:imidazole glycerol phosphate synthase subunit HisH [Accumulibacter sp.]